MKHCQSCGTGAAPDAHTCAACGFADWAVDAPAADPDSDTKPTKKPAKRAQR